MKSTTFLRGANQYTHHSSFEHAVRVNNRRVSLTYGVSTGKPNNGELTVVLASSAGETSGTLTSQARCTKEKLQS